MNPGFWTYYKTVPSTRQPNSSPIRNLFDCFLINMSMNRQLPNFPLVCHVSVRAGSPFPPVVAVRRNLRTLNVIQNHLLQNSSCDVLITLDTSLSPTMSDGITDKGSKSMLSSLTRCFDGSWGKVHLELNMFFYTLNPI